MMTPSRTKRERTKPRCVLPNRMMMIRIGIASPRAARVLVLVPTRELAAQVALEARRLLFGTGRTVALLHGGQSVKPQLEQLAFAPMVVVSTPGRLLTCAADEGYVSLEEVKTLILDEADQMVDMGFAPQVAEICRGEACGVPPAPLVSPHASFAGGAARDFRVGRQTLLFSATFPPRRAPAGAGHRGGRPGIARRPRASRSAASGAPSPESSRAWCSAREQPAGEKVPPARGGARADGDGGGEKGRDRNRGRGADDVAASDDRVLVFCAGKSTAKWVRAELTKLLDADTLMARARASVPRTFAAEELHGDCCKARGRARRRLRQRRLPRARRDGRG